jgi:hypothetical protein
VFFVKLSNKTIKNKNMKTIKIVSLSVLIIYFSMINIFANTSNAGIKHAQDIKVVVIVKNGEQLVQNANIEVFINGVIVASALTTEIGKADLLVKSYKHEKVTIITSYKEMKNDTLSNMELMNGKFYYVNLMPLSINRGFKSTAVSQVTSKDAIDNKAKEVTEKTKEETNQAKKDVKDADKAVREKSAKEAEGRIAKAKAEKEAKQAEKKAKSDAKKAKQEVKEASKIKKAEQKFQKRLSKIKKSQKKIKKSRTKLRKAQEKLDAKREKVTEESEFLKIKENQLKIDLANAKLDSKQDSLDEKLKSLNKKHNK